MSLVKHCARGLSSRRRAGGSWSGAQCLTRDIRVHCCARHPCEHAKARAVQRSCCPMPFPPETLLHAKIPASRNIVISVMKNNRATTGRLQNFHGVQGKDEIRLMTPWRTAYPAHHRSTLR